MKKRRVLLSGVSILLVLCLLIGGTMAWFTDTEKMDADFTAGVLDITVEPGEGATAPLTFVNLRPMQYQNFLEEINDAGNGNANVDGYDPKPVYFQPVVVENAGTLPAYIQLSVEALDMASATCPEGGEKAIAITENADGTETIVQSSQNGEAVCTNGLADVLKLVLFEKVNGSWTPIADNLNPDSEGTSYTPGLALPAGNGEQTYVVGAYLPETAGNEYQGKHFHGNLVVKAFQTDEGAGAAEMATVQWVKDGETVGSYLVAFPEGETTMTLKPDANKLPAGYVLADPDATVEVSTTDKTASFEVAFKADGDGSSEEQAIWIRSAEDFSKINDNMDGYYELGSDIDLSGMIWEPIGGAGSKTEKFTGTLDGNGYTIAGMQIKGEKQMLHVGLFGYCKDAELKNLVFEAPQVETNRYGGALAGVVSNTRIENCQVNGGSITWDYTKGYCYAGGLVGEDTGSSVLKDCSSSADVTAVGTAKSGVYLGGLIGGLFLNSTIDGCTASGDVTMTGSTQDDETIALGGLVGWVTGTAVNSSASGNVSNESAGTAGKIYVGGFAGSLSEPAEGCTATGDVSNTGSAAETYVGELAGNEDMLYTDGDGSSEEQAIWIRKARDFEKINENLDGYYKLARGIDLSDVDFQPIGGEESKNNFTGTFDGNGYKITGLHVEAAKDEKPLKYAGLFTYCKNAEIKNVVLVDPQVTTGEYGGALAGVLSSTNVENCQVIGGTVTWDDTGGSCYLGGLAGVAGDAIGDSTLTDCSSTADVTAEGTATSVVYVGGLIGEGYLNTTVDGCTASGNVTMTGDMQDEDTIALGGLIGWMNGTASNSSAKGNVSNESTGMAGRIYVGGFAGMLSDPAEDCEATGSVNNTGEAENVYVGEFSGNDAM